MAPTLFELLNIIAVGILAGTGTGLFIGYAARRQPRDWASMERRDLFFNLALILVCTVAFIALMAWYLYVYRALP